VALDGSLSPGAATLPDQQQEHGSPFAAGTTSLPGQKAKGAASGAAMSSRGTAAASLARFETASSHFSFGTDQQVRWRQTSRRALCVLFEFVLSCRQLHAQEGMHNDKTLCARTRLRLICGSVLVALTWNG
jgi:hypothetical protein